MYLGYMRSLLWCIVCYRLFVLQEFVGLIKHIAKTLTPIVNEDPHLIARDIANFERELSFVSVLVLSLVVPCNTGMMFLF